MRFVLQLLLCFKLILIINSQPCEKRLALLIRKPNITNNKLFYYNLVFNEDQYFEDTYKNEQVTYACLCNLFLCYRKCCPRGYLMRDNCTESNKAEDYYKQLHLYNETTRLNKSVEDSFIELYDNSCPSGQATLLNPQKRQEFYLQGDGRLMYTVVGYEYWVKRGYFCIELYERNGVQELLPLICQDVAITESTATHFLYGSLMIVSLPFWLITFLIYTLIPELRNLHGKCLANYAICVFIAFLFLSIIFLSGKNINIYLCLFAALIVYTLYMASFLWLSVMCIDIWLTFSGGRILNWRDYGTKKKFGIYSICVWSTTLIFLFNVLFLQFYGPKHFPYLVLPQIGVKSCWFADRYTTGHYFYGPILFLIILNAILFILTAVNIVRAREETRRTMKDGSKKHNKQDNQRFTLYLKLFLAFGINWAFELIPWLIGKAPPIQMYLDVINLLYGIFIFYISVCRRNVLREIKKRCNIIPWPVSSSHDVSTSTTSTTTDISLTEHPSK